MAVEVGVINPNELSLRGERWKHVIHRLRVFGLVLTEMVLVQDSGIVVLRSPRGVSKGMSTVLRPSLGQGSNLN